MFFFFFSVKSLNRSVVLQLRILSILYLANSPDFKTTQIWQKAIITSRAVPRTLFLILSHIFVANYSYNGGGGASLVNQMVKSLPAMLETTVRSGSGRSLGEGKSSPLQYSGLENSMDCIVQGSQRVGHFYFHFILIPHSHQWTDHPEFMTRLR